MHRIRARARLLLAVVAPGAIATAGVLAIAGPADAAVVDPPPISQIAGASTTLGNVWSVAVGPDGTRYVTSADTDVIAEFAAGSSGDVAPTATITGTDTGLDDPAGMAIDTHGDLWVANSDGAGSIEEFAPGASGNAHPIQTIAGAATQLDQPTGIAIGTDGTIFVANFSHLDIEVFAADAAGDVAPSRIIGGSTTNLDSVLPWGIALESDGSIVVSGYGNMIETFAADAAGDVAPLRQIAGSNTDLAYPLFVAVDQVGVLYAGNYFGDSLTEYPESADGNVTPTTEIAGATSQLAEPYAIAVDLADNLYAGNFNGTGVTEYRANLAVTGVTPATGSTAGGETVTVHGFGFAPGTTVTFDGRPATDVTVTSSTTLSVAAPAHTAGPVDVAVTFDGTTVTDANAFTYVAPLATTGVDPAPALEAGILLALFGGLLLAIRRRMAHPRQP